MSTSVKVQLLSGGKAPEYATEGSAGADVFANIEKDIILSPGERVLIPLGFAMEIPKNYEAQIRPRSGLAIKGGVTVLNSPGTIDSDYRGEVKVILINLGDQPYTLQDKDRIAQLIVSPVEKGTFVIVDSTSSTGRGPGGFGSTGT